MDNNQAKTWFITGASKGLGLSLVKLLLASGYRVAATSRNASQLEKAVGEHPQFLAIGVNLNDESSISAGIAQAIAHFGRIDVVVNNAGYGIGGSLEELSAKEITESFEVNVFATIHVIRAVLPQLRAQQSGHIINISSIAGFAAATGWAAYAATKYAVTGLTEVLAQDVAQFGIKATVVMPGAFRTEFLSAGSLVLSEKKMPEYSAIRDSHEKYAKMDGQQAGDPERAAEVLMDLAENPNPPVRLFLGSDAVKRAWEKTESVMEGIKEWKATSKSTDF